MREGAREMTPVLARLTPARYVPEAMDVARYVRRWVERTREEREAVAARERQAREGLPAVVRLLVDRYGARRVVLVGSLPRGTFHLGSDIDLLVEGLGFAEALTAWSEAAELIGLPVDLLRAEALPTESRRYLERWGQVLHG